MSNESPSELLLGHSRQRLLSKRHGSEHRLLHCDDSHNTVKEPEPRSDRHPFTCIPWRDILLSFRLQALARIWHR